MGLVPRIGWEEARVKTLENVMFDNKAHHFLNNYINLFIFQPEPFVPRDFVYSLSGIQNHDLCNSV